MRTAILAILPWYHRAEVEARHAETRKALRAAREQRRLATETLFRDAENGALHR